MVGAAQRGVMYRFLMKKPIVDRLNLVVVQNEKGEDRVYFRLRHLDAIFQSYFVNFIKAQAAILSICRRFYQVANQPHFLQATHFFHAKNPIIVLGRDELL